MMTTRHPPRLIATSYYDGPTEGFLNGMQDDNVYFFKVAAWDLSQDQRLFVVGRVERPVLEELLGLLEGSGQHGAGQIWLPSWKFADPKAESRVNTLIATAQRSLESPAFLAVGEDIVGNAEILRPSVKAIAEAVELTKRQSPGDLAAWLGGSSTLHPR